MDKHGITIVELNAVDAHLFKEFMKHYDNFSALVKAGVFEQKRAALTINIDAFGVLQSITRNDLLYSRKYDG